MDHIKNIRVVGSSLAPSWKIFNKQSWNDIPGLLEISVPEEALDPDMTVLAIEMDGPVQVYRGSGQVITFNE